MDKVELVALVIFVAVLIVGWIFALLLPNILIVNHCLKNPLIGPRLWFLVFTACVIIAPVLIAQKQYVTGGVVATLPVIIIAISGLLMFIGLCNPRFVNLGLKDDVDALKLSMGWH